MTHNAAQALEQMAACCFCLVSTSPRRLIAKGG